MNCGECLMEHVQVVPLREDGSCPCCEKNHEQPKGTELPFAAVDKVLGPQAH